MNSDIAAISASRNFRQTLEGMPLLFNPSEAGDLKAVIQFNVTGKEPGIYHFNIESGDCTFHKGASENPALTINTPSEVWMQIAGREITGQDALLKGLYKVEGNAGLLLRMNSLFKSGDQLVIRDNSSPAAGCYFQAFNNKARQEADAASPGKRPAGPIPLSGMDWMTAFFIPWTLFWMTFDIKSISPWIGSGIPLLLMALIVIYRLIFNRPVWTEVASLAFFVAALLLTVQGDISQFRIWGSVISQLFVGAMWLVSLSPAFKLPFSAEYSKWGFVRKLWQNSKFIQPNMAISLVWGWQFLFAAAFGIGARMLPGLFLPFTIIRYGLMVPAAIFTVRYQKGILSRRFADIDRTMSKLRIWAYTGLALTLAVILVIWFLKPPTQ